MGTLCFEGESEERLEYRLLEGSCRSGEVVAYLDLLAEKARSEGKPVVVVLDRAPFHRAGAVREERPKWEAKGLRLYLLPAGVLPAPEPHRGGVAQAEGFPDAASLLRLFGRTKASRPERIEVARSRGGSISGWRYLVTLALIGRTGALLPTAF